ncbi:hypothetical protein Hanom_Chr06g00508901 [Helianthus anomalus]
MTLKYLLDLTLNLAMNFKGISECAGFDFVKGLVYRARSKRLD